MDYVVYVLGAGFSAPLGLPVMSNFLIKSKDMYFADPKRYSHFMKVFDRIEEMSVAKNYYATDLFNIEEILSIIEMGSFADGRKLRKDFLQYIREVIEYHTPPLTPPDHFPSNWSSFIFGDNRTWGRYGFFVSNLCGVKFGRLSDDIYYCARDEEPCAHYAVVSLNYDLVLENLCSLVADIYQMNTPMGFCTERAESNAAGPVLAKLHGSIDGGPIVPPTWSKGSDRQIAQAWGRALEVLRKANQIRFVGYSLPTSDAYVRYLLKSAAMNCQHLKKIDVVCLDPDGTVRKRYDSFIEFNYYRFAAQSTESYLEKLSQSTHGSGVRVVSWHALESAHEEFMRSTAT